MPGECRINVGSMQDSRSKIDAEREEMWMEEV